jgi:hypothetical protein
MNLRQKIEITLSNHEPFLESEKIDLAAEILAAIEEDLKVVIQMRYAQRAYFRRRNEDNLSKAKKLENIVDDLLQPLDTKRQLVIQPDLLIF